MAHEGTRHLHADFVTELEKDAVAPILLAKINTSGGDVRAWTGLGTLSFGGEDYIGGGNFVGVSELMETNDLSAQGMAVSLSGIPSDLLAVALGQVQHGRPATIWLGLMGSVISNGVSSLALINTPYEIYSGFTDVTAISEQGETSTISINVENRLIALEVAKIRRYTHEIQKQDYPSDKGMEFVVGLQDKSFKFGS
jgi:hypothetical protein